MDTIYKCSEIFFELLTKKKIEYINKEEQELDIKNMDLQSIKSLLQIIYMKILVRNTYITAEIANSYSHLIGIIKDYEEQHLLRNKMEQFELSIKKLEECIDGEIISKPIITTNDASEDEKKEEGTQTNINWNIFG